MRQRSQRGAWLEEASVGKRMEALAASRASVALSQQKQEAKLGSAEEATPPSLPRPGGGAGGAGACASAARGGPSELEQPAGSRPARAIDFAL